jgi:flagellar biosynthetic protein FliR
MFSFTSDQLQVLVASLLWPLTRILGLIAAAPLFGNNSVPARLKIGLGILLALTIAPILPPGPAQDPIGFAGLLILVQQFLIGLGLGFAMRIVFATVELAGELMGLTMGLGFATLFDPQSQGRSSAISQFLALIATMTFLAINGHLLLLASLAESFTTLPISAAPLHGVGFYQIAVWGGKIFSTGVQLSLPIIAALLIINVSLAILTRAAPQLNIFGIGFPLTLGVGFLLVWLILPYMAVPIENLLRDGFDKLGAISRALAGLAGGAPGLK